MSLLYPRQVVEQVVQEHGLSLDSSEKETLLALVDTVFFTSLMLDEGEPARVAIVHDKAGASGLAKIEDSESELWGEDGAPLAWNVTKIAPQSFEPQALAKLSVGLHYGTHLVVVGGRAPALYIDGIARRNLYTDGGLVTRIAAPRPGVIVFELGQQELLRYDAGRRAPTRIDVLSEKGPVREAAIKISGAQQQGDVFGSFRWTLERLLHQMRAKGHGAILALLPTLPDETVVAELKCRRDDPQVLAALMRTERQVRRSWIAMKIATADSDLSAERAQDLEAKRAAREEARKALEAAIEDTAHLSAIDGAVLAGPGLAIYGAGHIIRGNSKVERVKSLDAEMAKTDPLPNLHGARHDAAFLFAHDNPGALAFVVSEDGPVHCALKVDHRVVVWSVYVPET